MPPVFIYTLRFDAADIDSNASLAALSANQRSTLERYRGPAARRSFIASRLLLKRVFAERLGEGAVADRLIAGPHGKPEIPQDFAGNWQFNYSHSRNRVLVAIHESLPLGVDVEFIHRRNDVIKIADRYFSAAELAQLNGLVEASRRDRFFDLWTLKESYVKAVGRGIGLGLSRFSFVFDDRDALAGELQRLDRDPEIEDSCPQWHSRVGALDSDFRWALTVAAGESPAAPEVAFRDMDLQSLLG